MPTRSWEGGEWGWGRRAAVTQLEVQGAKPTYADIGHPVA